MVRRRYLGCIRTHNGYYWASNRVALLADLGKRSNFFESLQDLYENRLILRPRTEESEDVSDQLRRSMHSQRIKAVGQDESFNDLE